MRDKIKSYNWLPWAVAFVIVIAIAIGGSYFTNWYILEPWSLATSLVKELSVDAFSSGQQFETFAEGAGIYWDFRLTALAVLMLTFIVGPSLWIFAEINNQDSQTEDTLKKGIVWYMGVILVVSSLQVVPTTVVKGIVFQNTWDNADQNAQKDKLRSDLMKLGYEALEKYHIPAEAGGGDGSFQKMNNGKEMPLSVADLGNNVELSGFSYDLETVDAESLITIHAVGDSNGPDANFENADGRKGKIEMTLQVKPPANFKFKDVNVR